MKDTLLFIVEKLVDHPEALSIVEEPRQGATILRISAQQEDIGKIIGKNGRIIRALRDIIKILAAKRGVYADVEINEQESNASHEQNEQDKK